MMSVIGLFCLPFLLAIFMLCLRSVPTYALRRIAFALSLLPLIMLIFGYQEWVGSSYTFKWFPPLNIEFFLKIDFLTLLFLFLSAIIIPFAVFAAPRESLASPTFFYFLIFMLEGLLFGFFMTRDLFMFTLFWEAMLIPLYFIIAYWGRSERYKAAFQFLVYMIAGSFLMVAAILGLYLLKGTFNMETLAGGSYPWWMGAIFLLAFAVKTPLFPFHGWLPNAYAEAPTSGSILLAGLLSKAGIYGILRVGQGLFPDLLHQLSPVLLTLAFIGVFYGAFAAWGEKDYKRLISYSSFSHVNYIMVGLFAFTQISDTGAIIQAFNHGITITALFLVAWWLESRVSTTRMEPLKGMTHYFPYLSWVTLFFVFASVALPGTSNFIGEFVILIGLFGIKPWLAAALCLFVILSAIYMLRWMQKVYFGPHNAFETDKKDIGFKEFCVALPLMALILWIGFYPAPFLDKIAAGTPVNTTTPAAEELAK